MSNNDILRRIRYTFDIKDAQMVEIFALANEKVNRDQVNQWLGREDEEGYTDLSDLDLAKFLNGLIIEKRGKKEGPQPVPEAVVNNNIILRKLKIALNLQAEDMLEMLQLGGMQISKHELSAFFRNPKQSQYRDCKDQVLRNFLNGMQVKYRPTR